ncbi:MAG: PspC domain-containing protein [Paraprevotella sp.]|nr:PspC domain-containing protein [Paraprevotella sp.]MBQ8282727.1 PspC domain-containing protein [Paraprevotella sp.]MBR2380406.1 PspC domain-containing protein [Paraprevotella sp.]
MNNKKLRRSTKDCMIAGVCGGLGEFFGLDASLLRIIYILLSLFSAGFPGLLIYIIMVLVVPKDNVE